VSQPASMMLKAIKATVLMGFILGSSDVSQRIGDTHW